MADDQGTLLQITVPFGQALERVNSARYHWDSYQRCETPFVIIQRTISGHGAFLYDGLEHLVPAGYAFLAIPPEQGAYYYPPGAGEPWVYSWLNLYGPLGILLCRELRELYGPVLPLEEHSAAGLAFTRLISAAAARVPRDVTDLSIEAFAFLMEWKRQLSDPKGDNVDPVDAVLRICQTRFREPLGTKELAEHAGLSREHLTRVFTDRQGISPARYLRSLRVEAAHRMLGSGTSSYKEVALRCGFPSIRALHRALGEASPRLDV